jgi:hypothetical protein
LSGAAGAAILNGAQSESTRQRPVAAGEGDGFEEASLSVELTEAQQKALDTEGDGLRVLDPRSGTAYVLVRADGYERLASGDYEASPWTEEEMDALAAEDAD